MTPTITSLTRVVRRSPCWEGTTDDLRSPYVCIMSSNGWLTVMMGATAEDADVVLEHRHTMDGDLSDSDMLGILDQREIPILPSARRKLLEHSRFQPPRYGLYHWSEYYLGLPTRIRNEGAVRDMLVNRHVEQSQSDMVRAMGEAMGYQPAVRLLLRGNASTRTEER